MGKRQNLKTLFLMMLFVVAFFATSCSNSVKENGKVSFKIPATTLQSIAYRAGEVAEESGYTENQQNKVRIKIEISLHYSNNKTIETKTQEGTLEQWKNNPDELSFSFANVEAGKSVYAKAKATASIRGEVKELASGKSETKAVDTDENSNNLAIELSFDPKDFEEENQNPGEGEDDEKNLFQIQTTIKGLPEAITGYGDLTMYALTDEAATELKANITDAQKLITTLEDSQKSKWLGNYGLQVVDNKPQNDKLTIQTEGQNITVIVNDSFVSGGTIFQAGKSITLLAIASDPYNETTSFYTGFTAQAFTITEQNIQEITLEAQETVPVKISFFINDEYDEEHTQYISLPTIYHSEDLEDQVAAKLTKIFMELYRQGYEYDTYHSSTLNSYGCIDLSFVTAENIDSVPLDITIPVPEGVDTNGNIGIMLYALDPDFAETSLFPGNDAAQIDPQTFINTIKSNKTECVLMNAYASVTDEENSDDEDEAPALSIVDNEFIIKDGVRTNAIVSCGESIYIMALMYAKPTANGETYVYKGFSDKLVVTPNKNDVHLAVTKTDIPCVISFTQNGKHLTELADVYCALDSTTKLGDINYLKKYLPQQVLTMIDSGYNAEYSKSDLLQGYIALTMNLIPPAEEKEETPTKIAFDFSISNTDSEIQNITPTVSLFFFKASHQALANGRVASVIDNPKSFIKLMADENCLIGVYDALNIKNNVISIKDSIDASENLNFGDKVYVLAVANYDNWDLFENQTQALENAAITTYRGLTSEITIAANTKVSISLEKEDIPCEVTFWKKASDRQVLYKLEEATQYVAIGSYNDNTATQNLILQEIQCHFQKILM